MNYNIDEAMSAMGTKRSNYSLEEIEAAKKRQKKHGGTIKARMAENGRLQIICTLPEG